MKKPYKELLSRYLDGKCSQEELCYLKSLLDEQDVQEKLHEIMQERQAKIESLSDDNNIKERVFWMNLEVQRRIDAPILSEETKRIDFKKHQHFKRFLAAASLIGIVFLFSIIGYKMLDKKSYFGNTVSEVTKINDGIYPLPCVLPDSSVVYLDPGSKINYYGNYGKTERKVTLIGKAFFEVVPNKNSPFIVHSNGTQTKVLGTSFLIDSKLNYTTEVSVATGRVAVNIDNINKNKKLSILTPGKKLKINLMTNKLDTSEIDIKQILSWKQGDIEFNRSPLSNVFRELSLRYKYKIVYKDTSKMNYRISGVITKDQELDSVVKMLSIIGDFRYNISNNKKTIQIFN